jgi:hypothetical protein
MVPLTPNDRMVACYRPNPKEVGLTVMPLRTTNNLTSIRRTPKRKQ